MTKMCRYETLFLTVPEITGDEIEKIKSQFSKVIRDAKAEMVSFERWGKYRLAYSVRHNEYGVYFLIRFDVAQEARNALLTSIQALYKIKLSSLVMKNIVSRLNAEDGLEYKRPESLEDNPHDVETFLKKNEMGGLLKKRPTRKAEDAAAPVKQAVEKKAEEKQVDTPAKDQATEA